MGRGDTALHQRHIDAGVRVQRPRLGKVDDIHQFRQHQQRLTQIEQSQLAAVAGTEFVDREFRFTGIHYNSTCCESTLVYLVTHSKTLGAKKVGHLRIAENRAILTHELRPNLTVTALSKATLHIPLPAEPHLPIRKPHFA